MRRKSKSDKPASLMDLALIDRQNNSVISSQAVDDSQNPLLLPSPDTFIWHYVRFDFFRALLTNKAMWLTRLDQQTDQNDGMYSDANAHQWTPVVQKLLEGSGFKNQPGKDDWQQLQWTNQELRQRTFIHCWSIRAKESAWMWNTFVSSDPRSVALRSTVGALLTALRGQPVDFFKMLYCSAGQPRPDWSYTAPFSGKDKVAHFCERELRVFTLLDGEAVEDVGHKLIPVDLKQLIRKVVVHPASSRDFRLEVRNELKAHTISAQLAGSQLTTFDLKAANLHHSH